MGRVPKSTRAWYTRFVTDGSVCKGKSTGRPSVSAERVETIRQSFVRSPHKSVRRASKELNVPKKTAWQVLRKRLHLRPYGLQILQQLKPADKVKRCDFCCNFLGNPSDHTIMNKLVFGDDLSSVGTSESTQSTNLVQWKSSVLRTWQGQSQVLSGSVTRRAVRAMLLCPINSDSDHLPGHVTWMINAAATGEYSRRDLLTTIWCPTALPSRSEILPWMNVFVIVGSGVEALRNGLRDRLIWHRWISSSGGLWRAMSTSLTADNTARAQDTDQRGLCKHWSGNSAQRMAGCWMSVWCCLSHSWRSHWTLLMTNYCS
jgi:hypothetical protein